MASFSMLVPKSSKECLNAYSQVFLKHSWRNTYRFCILFCFHWSTRNYLKWKPFIWSSSWLITLEKCCSDFLECLLPLTPSFLVALMLTLCLRNCNSFLEKSSISSYNMQMSLIYCNCIPVYSLKKKVSVANYQSQQLCFCVFPSSLTGIQFLRAFLCQ